ncbi:hypothetical protein, partial [Ruminococcus sp.]|uniref:hypothetical protein n=1 Tax=Ruminococcus sp. TaxID=41978 RepID=UPI00386E8986
MAYLLSLFFNTRLSPCKDDNAVLWKSDHKDCLLSPFSAVFTLLHRPFVSKTIINAKLKMHKIANSKCTILADH